MSNHLLCVGLDGATLDVVEPLTAAGYLPNLAALMTRGAWGRLRSTQPPLSPPAWATFATGVNPGVHGVFDFVSRTDAGGFQVSNGASLRVPTLWARVSERGRTVGVINVPLTYPPQPVNGFLISGMDAPRKSVATTHPAELSAEIAARFGAYWVERHTASLLPMTASQFTRRYIADTLAMTRRRGEVAAMLLRERRPDLMIVVFVGADRLQHLEGAALAEIMALAGSVGDRPELERLARNPVTLAYRAADAEVGRLLAEVDETWHVMVMSDHGFQPYRRIFSINTWLSEQGYLTLDPGRLNAPPAGIAARLLARLRARAAKTGEDGPLARLFGAIDWGHTRAYSFGAFGSIYLNLAGREPAGQVASPAEGETLLTEITARLLRWRDPETGIAPIAAVRWARTVYAGPFVGWGPDLLLETAPGYFIRNSLESYQARLVEPAGRYSGRQLPHTAMHHPDGLLCLAGPAVRPRPGQPGPANLLDLAPTVLYLLGERVPSYMEGRVLADWLDERFVVAHGITSATETTPSTAADDAYTDEEARLIAAHLAGLGYL